MITPYPLLPIDNLEGDEVAEFLGKIMNQELGTLVVDNSLEEIMAALCNHFKLAMDPSKFQELGGSQIMSNHGYYGRPLKSPYLNIL